MFLSKKCLSSMKLQHYLLRVAFKSSATLRGRRCFPVGQQVFQRLKNKTNVDKDCRFGFGIVYTHTATQYSLSPLS